MSPKSHSRRFQRPLAWSALLADHLAPSQPSLLGRLRADREGAAAAEFGLIIPIFMTLVAATIQYGSMLVTYNNMLNSARSASREVAVGKSNHGQANGKAKSKRPRWVADEAYAVDTRDVGTNEVETVITVPGDAATVLPLLPMPDELTVTVVMNKEA